MESLFILFCKFPQNIHSLSHTYITNMPIIVLSVVVFFLSHTPNLKECQDGSTRREEILMVLSILLPSPRRGEKLSVQASLFLLKGAKEPGECLDVN